MTTDPAAAIPAALAAAVPALAARVGAVRVEGARVSIVLDVGGLDAAARAAADASVRNVLAGLPGVEEVRILATADRRARHLIAVASGKGGVGKSTVAANLAVALARDGVRTGLIDADIYGPSIPRLLGTEGARPGSHDKVLIPIPTRFGVAMLSMGNLVSAEKAIAWRGPMASGALGQMVEADWGGTQVIIVDLPPGTGDVQLSMIQKYRPAGAVIVSTPQDLALIDAVRAIDLFATAAVPVIGLVENMAGYACPACGVVSDPFGSGGAEDEARARGLPFLGRIPLDRAIRSASDAGDPPAAGEAAIAAPFAAVARAVRNHLETINAA